jgi:hypothetical protein
MARNLNDIKTQITQRYVAEMAAIGVVVDSTNWSVVSLERCIISVFAFCSFVLENLMDVFKAEINETIAQKNPHTKNWYKNTVLAYLHGFVVDAKTLQYNLSGVSEAAIQAAQIVKYCAVADGNDGLNVKIAKDVNGDLQPLTASELAGLKDYMEDSQLGQKDAGVFINFINEDADNLQLTYDIYVNPSVIDTNGVHIVTGVKVVEVAIYSFLKSIEFNGVFAPQILEDKLRDDTEGVELVKLKRCNVKADSASSWTAVDVKYLPNSGYLKIANPTSDLIIEYKPS